MQVKLNIYTFKLSLERTSLLSLANQFIPKVMKLGIVDLDIHVHSKSVLQYLDQLLESQTLATLSLDGFTINLHGMKEKEVNFPNL